MSRSFRKGQIVGPAGPGAIVDLGDESFAVMSTDTWRVDKLDPCDLPRLSKRLGVVHLKQPRSGDHKNPNSSIGLLRFPRWLFCPSCRHMVRWTEDDERQLDEETVSGKPVCRRSSCRDSIQLVPMRFVQICDMGHLDDVDWLYWVHRGGHQCQKPEFLKFVSLAGRGSGLGSLRVVCEQCGADRGLDELRELKHACRSERAVSGGRQPWQRNSAAKPCSSRISVVQRGESNVHFASVVSALDIPNPSQHGEPQNPHQHVLINTEFMMQRELWYRLQENGVPLDTIKKAIRPDLHESLGITQDTLFELLERVESDTEDGSTGESDPLGALKSEEFIVLADPESRNTSVFSGESYTPSKVKFGGELSRIIERVSLIDRLREVRAFRGFHRKTPSGHDLVPASLDPSVDWLPAHEVFGEGLFLKFNAASLSEWSEALPREEHDRLQNLQDRMSSLGIRFLPEPSAPLIAVHSLSHLLMRQLCFDSGYASGSLRERLYVDGDSIGLLIYTADGDSEGTMGGLVRQGHTDRLPKVFARALKAASWCSADPLCAEGENQGMAGLNRAACHACVLMSETSCESANALLDRRFLIGVNGGFCGLFSPYLNEHGIA